MPKSLLTSPTELKLVNVSPDTLYVNFKFADEHDIPTGDSLPLDIASQLDDWQKEARKDHAPVPTSLTFAYATSGEQVGQTLLMRSHGSSMWSWLLYCDDIKELKFAHGTVNKGLFCQVRFSSHLLHSIGAERAIVAAEEMLYAFMGAIFHKQMSELHLCADLQGFDFSTIRLLGEQLPFVSRVTNIRDRPVPPTEEEQEGGLSAGDIHTLEATIEQQITDVQQEDVLHSPSVLTAHRRVQTIDFGSHGSDLSAQIYNKTAEMKKHKKEFFEPIHRVNGWDGESDIWRIEFRFKRAFLRAYELNEAFSVLACLRLLWRYATEHWLRFVDLDAAAGVNVSRLPTHPVWELIQHAYDGLGEDGLLVRRSRQMARLQACIAGALGYLRSAVALMPPDELPGFLGPDAPASRTLPDLLSSLLWFLDKARTYDKKKQRDHVEEVQKKRLRYGLVTSAQLEEERRTQGVVLAREDWGRVDAALDRLLHPLTQPYTDWFDDFAAAD